MKILKGAVSSVAAVIDGDICIGVKYSQRDLFRFKAETISMDTVDRAICESSSAR